VSGRVYSFRLELAGHYLARATERRITAIESAASKHGLLYFGRQTETTYVIEVETSNCVDACVFKLLCEEVVPEARILT
jgi:hypothetical protein